MMEYAGVAYCTIEWRHVEVETWTCMTCKKLPYLNATKVHDDETNTCGYVGYDPANNFIMVSFAGTDPLNIREWIDDIDAVTTAYTAGGCQDCKVHKGFYDAYLTVQSQVQSLVKQLITQHPTAKLYVTGHSLGAALACHGALDIAVNLGVTPQAVYNFGQPRVGNDNFQLFYQSKLYAYRVTHWRDPVPQLPTQRDGGFHQNPEEVWYDLANTNYTLCDMNGEDPNCSDGQLDDKVEDHLTYMNYDLTAEYLSCKF
jgi:hypothetical protein